jgi:hypothetical protein
MPEEQSNVVPAFGTLSSRISNTRAGGGALEGGWSEPGQFREVV